MAPFSSQDLFCFTCFSSQDQFVSLLRREFSAFLVGRIVVPLRELKAYPFRYKTGSRECTYVNFNLRLELLFPWQLFSLSNRVKRWRNHAISSHLLASITIWIIRAFTTKYCWMLRNFAHSYMKMSRGFICENINLRSSLLSDEKLHFALFNSNSNLTQEILLASTLIPSQISTMELHLFNEFLIFFRKVCKQSTAFWKNWSRRLRALLNLRLNDTIEHKNPYHWMPLFFAIKFVLQIL